MNNQQYEELSGRIEGLANFLIGLTAELEINGMIDGDVFTGRIRNMADKRQIAGRPVFLSAAQRMLTDMAERLDQMREARQSLEN